jgi:predicted ATPase
MARRVAAYAYTLVTTAIVLLFALAEWATERYVSGLSRAASTSIEILIVLVATLAFRPVHKLVDGWLEAAFNRRKHHALEALRRFRQELSSFSDAGQLLRRAIEAVEHHLEARACAVYVRGDGFHAERSSFDEPAGDVGAADPLVVRLRSSGAPARPALLESAARGTHAFPMTVAGDLVGFLAVDARDGEYDADETQMLAGLAADLGIALVAVDPMLRAKSPQTAHNVPAGLPTMLGRERELGEIEAVLAQSRLVTITGSGGVGKTRIALQCAIDAADRYQDGAWLVDLAPIADGKLVTATILSALDAGAADQGAETARLIEYLRPRNLLLAIDNCEQVVAAAAAVIARIRAACPDVAIVATSRELLHLDGEQVYRLGSLRREASIDLFSERALAVAPGFDADACAGVISNICGRLDDVPLAIELAAARVRTLSAGEILTRLDERFRLLTSGARTALPRQQTLAAMIEWSYDLLTAEEQSLLRNLSVFRGSFSLAAAAAVCAGGNCDEFHTLDVLTSLADKSLLTVSLALTTRYRLLETIREFAAQKAVERRATQIAAEYHASYFSALAAQAYHEFDAQTPRGWLERLAPDIDNFRAALEWMLEGPGDRRTGAQFAADCGPVFLRLQLLGEGLRWCESARGAGELPPATAARIDYVASMMYNNAGDYPRALEAAQRAVASYERSSDERGLIRALSQIAQQYANAKRFDDARRPATEAIERARRLGEARVLVAVLRRCAYALPPEDVHRARALFQEALDRAMTDQDTEETALVLQWWANREASAGCFDRALRLAEEGLRYAGRDASMYLENQAACFALASSDVRGAEAHARRALELSLELGNPLIRAMAIVYCAPYLAKTDARNATLLLGYARAALARLDWETEGDEELAMQNAMRITGEQPDMDEFSDLLDRGAVLTEPEALAILNSESAGHRSVHGSAPPTGDGIGALLR